MKKRNLSLALCTAIALSLLTACSGGTEETASAGQTEAETAEAVAEESAEEAEQGTEDEEVPEQRVVRWNQGTSGNVLVFIAQEKGYFEEEGIELEFVTATANADAMALLSTGQTDVVSNSGTSNPLQQIAAGVDLTVFGGHMVNGCMPVIAREGTEWNGVESLVGKKFACNPVYFAFTGALMDAGYEKPLEALEWITYTNYQDAMAAVLRGEVDYALQGTGQNYQVLNTDGIEIVAYQSDVMPNYSCCRLVAPTEFVEENPITIKHILRALIRAQQFYESNKEESAQIMADAIGTDLDYVEAFMFNDHYLVHADPLKNSVVRAWNILDETGFLDEKAKDINIEDHINTDIYEEALAEVIAEHGDEDPEFYEGMQQFYEENDK